MFIVYAVLAVVALVRYRRLSQSLEEAQDARAPLRGSRRIVYALRALFSLDSSGAALPFSGCWRCGSSSAFNLTVATVGTIFFWTGVFSAASYLIAARLANKNRPGQYDALHASPIECAAAARAVHAEPSTRDRATARTLRAFSNGRSAPQFLRDSRRGACRAPAAPSI